MSSTIQSMDSIGPMASSSSGGRKDPLQEEYEKGRKYLDGKEYGQAAVCLHNALVGFEENKNDNGIANASNQLGHLCLARKDFKKALVHYRRAAAICDGSNDRMSVLAVLHKVVDAHRGLAEYNEAIRVCLDILDHYHDNRNPQGTVQTLETMAEIYLAGNQKEKAADAYRTISSIHKNFKHDRMAGEYLDKAIELEK